MDAFEESDDVEVSSDDLELLGLSVKRAVSVLINDGLGEVDEFVDADLLGRKEIVEVDDVVPNMVADVVTGVETVGIDEAVDVIEIFAVLVGDEMTVFETLNTLLGVERGDGDTEPKFVELDERLALAVTLRVLETEGETEGNGVAV